MGTLSIEKQEKLEKEAVKAERKAEKKAEAEAKKKEASVSLPSMCSADLTGYQSMFWIGDRSSW